MGAAASSRRRFEQLLFSPLSPPFLLHTSSSSTPDVDTRFRLFYSSPLFLHLFFKLLSLATAFLPIRSMPLLNKPSLRSFPEIGILILVDPSLFFGWIYLPVHRLKISPSLSSLHHRGIFPPSVKLPFHQHHHPNNLLPNSNSLTASVRRTSVPTYLFQNQNLKRRFPDNNENCTSWLT